MLWLLAGYMWLFIHRPFEVWPWLGVYHIERIYMLLTIAAWAAAGKTWTPNRLNKAFFAQVCVILVSWLASPYGDAGSHAVEEYLKVAVFFVLIVSVVRDERSLRHIVLLYLAAMSLYMAHSLREYFNGRHIYRMGIARLVGVDESCGDPNSFSATILYSLPIALAFWTVARTRVRKLLLGGYGTLSIVCIILTGSRSAFVGLIAALSMLVMTSAYRWRVALMLAVLLPVGWTIVPEPLQNRFMTLIDPTRGPKNAQGSAETRGEGWRDGVRIWKDHLFLGIGPGAFQQARGYNLQAHQLYGQVLGELGTAGAISLAWLVTAFALNSLEARRDAISKPWLRGTFSYSLSQAVFMDVVLLLLMGFGGHNLYRYTWMWFGAFQAIAMHLLKLTVMSEAWPGESSPAPDDIETCARHADDDSCPQRLVVPPDRYELLSTDSHTVISPIREP